MSIEFICPVKGISNSFPDAYAGVKYRCKHCAGFHTLPQSEDYVHQGILSACPNTDEVVSIDSKLKTKRFLCASCGQVHEVPGEENANSNSTEIASSTKYQNQARQKIIPSVRKRSLLADEENAKIGSRTNTPAINVSDKKSDNKIGSRTNLSAVPTTERKLKSPTERKRSSLQPYDEDESNSKSRKPYTRPKKKFSFLNFFLTLLFLGIIGGIVYLFLQSEKVTSNLGDLNSKIQLAEKEASRGNFEQAINISNEIIEFVSTNPALKDQVNFKDIENKNQKYKNQNIAFKKIEEKIAKIESNPQLNGSGIEKCFSLLIEEKNALPGDISFNKPIYNALETIQTKLKTKQLSLLKTALEKLFQKGDAEYQQGNLIEYSNKIQEITKAISKLETELKTTLNAEFNSKFKEFEDRQAIISNIETIYQKSVTTPLFITELINELKAIDSNTNIKDVAIKNIIEQRANSLREKRKIIEIKKIDGLLRDKDRIKKDLQEFLGQLSPTEGIVKIELAKHLSRVMAKLHEIPTFQNADIENLKQIASLIGNTLNETQEPLLMKIDAEKNSISWQDENVKSYAGYDNLEDKLHFIFSFNGLRIAFPQALFQKNPGYFIRYAKNLHDLMILSLDDNIFTDTPWVVTEDILQISAPVAIHKTPAFTKLFLVDKTYQLKENKPLYINEPSIKQEIASQINKAKSILLNSNEGLEVKANLNLCLHKMIPQDSSNLIDYAPNVTWLLNNEFERFLTDPTCIKAVKELKNYWEQNLYNQMTWLEGTAENKTTLELFKVFGNRICGRIYNPEKIETTFILPTVENYSVTYNDLVLNSSFHNIYQGNQQTLPDSAPIRIFTLHPLGGIISVFNSISNKLEVNLTHWNKTFESSKLFGKQGETKTLLAPHSLRINKDGSIKEIYSVSFITDISDKPNSSDFSKWVEENKNNFNTPEKINLLLLLCGGNHQADDTLNILTKFASTNLINANLKRNKIANANHTIPIMINTFLTNASKPNIMLNLKNEIRNLWIEKQDSNQNLFYLRNNFIHRSEIQDFTRDFRVCLQNDDNIYYNQYKLPITRLNKEKSKWQTTYVPCLLLSDILTEEDRNNLINGYFDFSSNKLENFLVNSLFTSLKEIDLFNYIIYENQFLIPQASQSFASGVKGIKKEVTLSAKLEHLRLKLLNSKEKDPLKDFDEIHENIISSDQFKKEPKKITDARYYFAKELTKNGKFAKARSLLNPFNENKLLTLSDIYVYADLCFSRFLQFEKEKSFANDYKSDIAPIQDALEVSFKEVFEKSVLDIDSILKLNLAWVKMQSSKQGIDICDQQLLLPVTNETKKLPFFGKEKIDCQWNWARQNPLCYHLIIQKILADVESDKEVESKQRLNISSKLIQAMIQNCFNENSVWKNHPYQALITSYSISNDINEKKWQSCAEKISQLWKLNHADNEYFKFLAIHTQVLPNHEIRELIKQLVNLDMPNEFYKNLFQDLHRLKYIKKSKDIFTILKETVHNKNDLISDLEKRFLP